MKQVIHRYLDCGILHNGFARVKCGEWGHEFLLAFSCKRRHFCPSCHQKRIAEFGDFLGFHPHLHILCTEGCSYADGMFRIAPIFELKRLEEIFMHKVFKMLLSKEKITPELVDMHKTWRHSGFNVFCGPRIQPGDDQAMENLARYIVRASFSQERMTYVREMRKS